MRDEGRICRFGAGIYGVGRTKVFEAAPQALAALSYEILPGRPVRGYSERPNGTVIRLNKRCRRKIRGRGVWLTWETPTGKTVREEEPAMTALDRMPTLSEIEDHYHRLDYCESLARAEKDLLVQRALDAIEMFDGSATSLAVDGGTGLAAYHGMLTRFSEGIYLRIVLPDGLPRKGDKDRVEFVKATVEKFAQHIAEALPWLTRTRQGLVRKDGVLQAFIYNYTGRYQSEAVQQGIKFELVDMPMRLPPKMTWRTRRRFPAVAAVEIVAGKWTTLAERIPGSKRSYPDLVRHLHDIAMISPSRQGARLPAGLLLRWKSFERIQIGTTATSTI